ncbi:MAG: mechanosensitive ion channel family protein [Bacillota bacterium]
MSLSRTYQDIVNMIGRFLGGGYASPGSTVLKAAVVIFLAWVVVSLGGRLVEALFLRGKKGTNKTAPVETPKNLIKMTLVYSIYLLAVLSLMEIFHFKIIQSSDLKNIGGMLFKVVAIILISRLLLRFGVLITDQLLFPRGTTGLLMEERRAQTLRALLRSLITYAIYFFAGMMILGIFNIQTSSILAGAGIVGLAVGFGAQNLVRDVITGFFIILEDQFSVGEYVNVVGLTGVVEELGLRTTKIREWTGQLHIIPNGEIKQVTNFHRGNMLAVVEVRIAYEEDVNRAIEVMRKAAEQAQRELPSIVEVPVVQGVVELGESAVVVRVIAHALPGEQWAVERGLRQQLKVALDAENITLSSSRRVLVCSGETAGSMARKGQMRKEDAADG